MTNDRPAGNDGRTAFIVVILLLTVIGAGSGLAVGMMLQGPDITENATQRDESKAIAVSGQPAPPGLQSAPAPSKRNASNPAREQGGNPPNEDEEVLETDLVDGRSVKVVPFPPVLTTLAEPRGRWIRLEGSLLVSNESKESPEFLAEKCGDYILAYLRSVKLHQIEGPAGLFGLKQDLDELVSVLTDGDARGVLIHGLIVE